MIAEQEMAEGTASALINNFRCLMTGTPIKAPMSAGGMEHFTDTILSMKGGDALKNIVLALEGFIQYSKSQWGNEALGMQRILARLQQEEVESTLSKSMDQAVRELYGAADSQSVPDEKATEVLREIWVRGPQHAAFRRALLRRWNRACSVHGVACNDHLRASHIVAWRSDEAIRGDVNNGLLLSVPLDSLFDRGLISFSSEGEMLFSKQLAKETKTHFGLRPELRIAWSHLPGATQDQIRRNLARHRETYSALHGYL
ncbi:HNH endonuclease [Variovorax sp. 38R]|uniref:HNH endonuclease n=1 Tax=Variovorax sp. 38R TaxID=2774875 RepID=UPI00177C1922|nr:HNH endonuclease signature motif containing protein [Variovorax sp. 38R]QOF76719.1 HNH endonuclease [Variovorax sp. 38R]